MQLTIEIDDNLAQAFFDITPKDEQKHAFRQMFAQYLQTKTTQKTDDELDFVGMWADRQIDSDVISPEVINHKRSLIFRPSNNRQPKLN